MNPVDLADLVGNEERRIARIAQIGERAAGSARSGQKGNHRDIYSIFDKRSSRALDSPGLSPARAYKSLSIMS